MGHFGKLRADDIARAIPASASVDPYFAEQREQLLSGKREEGRKADINYTTFLAAMLDKERYLYEPVCRAAFNLLDLDGDGLLRLAELSVIVQSIRKDET